ncbi:MAG: hypothetical protein IMW92_01200 [Bacillales bacterium]|nr:hypothetical protein [Bacillales bacterium]
MYQVKLWKGVLKTRNVLYELEQAETIRGLGSRVIILLLVSVILSAVSSCLGIGSEDLSHRLVDWSANEFASRKVFFVLGSVFGGILFVLFVLVIPSLLFWGLMEVDFRKALVLQLFVLTILLVEKAILFPIEFLSGVKWYYSPFALGTAIRYLTDHSILIRFFGSISLFQMWALVLQYRFLKRMTDHKPLYIAAVIAGLSIVFWAFTAFFTSIHIEKLI